MFCYIYYVVEAYHKEPEYIKMAIYFFVWQKDKRMCAIKGDHRWGQQQKLSVRSDWVPRRSSYSGILSIFCYMKILLKCALVIMKNETWICFGYILDEMSAFVRDWNSKNISFFDHNINASWDTRIASFFIPGFQQS